MLDEAPDGEARVVATGEGTVGRDLTHEVTDEWLAVVRAVLGAPAWSEWSDGVEYPGCLVTTRRAEWPELTLIERSIVNTSQPASVGASHLAGFVVPAGESPSIENLLADRAGETIGDLTC